MISCSNQTAARPNYFGSQPDIKEHMRKVLINWLIDVHSKYKLQPQTLFICIQLIDSYLERRTIYRNRLQLLGITALWMAAKYEETYQVPKLKNLIFICDSAYTAAEILEMEAELFLAVDFDLIKVTMFSFFEVLAEKCKLKEK